MSTQRRRARGLYLEILEDRCVPATFTVTNLMDGVNVAGSLRRAIDNANLNPNLDTIVFKPGLEGVIKLSAGELSITSNLVLAGPGSSKITVDGDATYRIFTIGNDIMGFTGKNVTIKGLTLFNGFTMSGGGGILCYENLTMIKSVITGNSAPGAGNSGGGLAGLGNRTTLRRCTIIGNEAGIAGGGVYLNSVTALIDQCTIAGNGADAEGGAVHVEGGNLTIRNSTLSGNQTNGTGGGLDIEATPYLRIENSTITGNDAEGQGGGVYSDTASVSVKNSKITFNTSFGSGAGLRTVGVTKLDRCTITGNAALGDAARGGGIRHDGGYLTLTNSTVSGNRTGSQGGGICVTNTTAASTIQGCTIAGNIAYAGGGVWSENNQLQVERSVLSSNAGLDSSGGIGQNGSYLRMTDCTVSGNHALDHGGGGIDLRNTTGVSVLSRCTLSGNMARSGAGLHITSSYQVLIQNSTISGNRAVDGGGILVNSSMDLTVQNSTIAFNRGLTEAGGIEASYANVNLQSTIVSKNSAPTSPDLLSDQPTDLFNIGLCLIGDPSGSNAGTLDQATVDLLGMDPLLVPLANNGGPTQTHALKKGSPAINAGADFIGTMFDQRGKPFKRKLGPAVDIGAFERQ